MAKINQPQSTNDFLFNNEWSHGICGCFDDFKLCCCVFCCPCFSCCKIDKALGGFEYGKCLEGFCHGILGSGLIFFTGIGVPPCFLWSDFAASRGSIRTAYKINGSVCGDAFIAVCCEPCAQCQMHKELESHGATY